MLKDLYYIQLYKIYYKNVNNLLPAYFQTFTPNYNGGIDHNHDLGYNALRLPMTRKEYYVQCTEQYIPISKINQGNFSVGSGSMLDILHYTVHWIF